MPIRRPTPLLLVLALLALCACGASTREKTIKTTFFAVNEMRDGFVELDRQAQAAIVEAATSREQGAALLADYRKRREVVVETFELAYRALATATVVEVTPVSAAIDALRKLQEAIQQLKKRSPS